MCIRSETSGTSPSSAELAESETAERTLTLRANGSLLFGVGAMTVKGGESAVAVGAVGAGAAGVEP